MKRNRKQKQYIFVCHGKDCLKNGARGIHKCFEKELKASNLRSKCEVIGTKCMDHCKEGPSVVIDNIWYGKVAPVDIEKVLNKKAVK